MQPFDTSNQHGPKQSLSVEPPDESDLVNILDVLVESRWLIVSVALLFVIVGGLYAFLAKPIYETDIMVQVEDSPAGANAKSLLGDVSSLFSEQSTAAAEVQIIKSRLVVSRAVDQLKLYISAEPKRFPLVGDWIARKNHRLSRPGIFGVGGYTWGRESIDVATFNVPGSLEGKLFRLNVLPDGQFKLSSSEFDGTFQGRVGQEAKFSVEDGVIDLLITSIKGEPGAEFELRRYSRQGAVDDLQGDLLAQEKVKQSDVVVASLQGTDPQRISSELNAIGAQYIRQNVERKSAEAAQSLEFLSVQMPQAKKRLEDAEARYTKMRDRSGTVDLPEEAKLGLQQLADARVRRLQLQQQRAELATRFNSSHPAVLALDQQIGVLQRYESNSTQKLKLMPDTQQEAARLMLDVQVNTDLYTGLLNNAQQLQLVKAGKVGNVRLVDSAIAPELPVKPKKSIILMVSALLGIVIGIGIAFLRNTLFRGVTDPSEIERHLGLNVYASIPISPIQKELSKKIEARETISCLLSAQAPTDPAVESLRSFRTGLQFAMLHARNNVVLLSGPAPGVGKSFVSANFSAVLAAGGKRILLVDGDMRKGHLNQYLGLPRGKGFSELIAGTEDIESVIHREVATNLDFISTGTLPPNPSELLLSERLSALFEAFSANYDIVVIDSPPVLVAADAAILSPLVGTIFLVAMSGATKIGELGECVKRLAQSGNATSGIIFNGLNPNTGKYGYGSKYGSYRYTSYTYERDN